MPHAPSTPRCRSLFTLSLLASSLAGAAEMPTLQAVTVSSPNADLSGVADSASEGRISGTQLARRPLLRPAEVLESVPGLIVTQHSGDGKANQYFLRGFNLDHGSDFATQVLGMPVNVVSHAHGQGYMDLNFLLPELIARVDYRKGMLAARDGDFVTSGAAEIDYLRRVDRNFVEIGLGERQFQRLLAVGSGEIAGRQWLGAFENSGYNGPWTQPQGLNRHNAVLRLSDGNAANGYSLAALAYQADWTATEHVPERAIASGEIARYGALSAQDGGRTQRYSLSGDWARTDASHADRLGLYAIDYGLNLYSNPSGYIGGLGGDQHEQADARRIVGGQASRSWFLGDAWRDSELTLGLQLRHDRAELGLYETRLRQRTATIREDRIEQTATAVYGELRTPWNDWLRSTLALRRDRIAASVRPLGGSFNAANGGEVADSRTSRRAGVVFGPFAPLAGSEFFANLGEGFHSNDARGATARVNPLDGSAVAAVPLIVRARGGELGWRGQPASGWHSSLSLWRMALASELVFIGDEGITEPRGASQRHGIDWHNELALPDAWQLSADLSWSRARFDTADPASGGRHVPNAVPLTASLALSRDDGGPWFGGLRLRYIGAYALESSGEQKSTPFWMANLRLGYRVSPAIQFSFDVLNLFDRRANDIEYWGGACTYHEAQAGIGGCGSGGTLDGRLVHPLEPRTLRLALRYRY